MAKKNFYAARTGRVPGIYKTWPECQKQVIGFAGAAFKGFETLEEAKAFMKGAEIRESLNEFKASTPSIAAKKPKANKVQTENTNDEGTIVPTKTGAAIAYVDGSYNISTKRFSYGAVIFYNGNEEHFSQGFSDKSLASMRNVAGEIKGAERAMQYCLDNDIDTLVIYFDYQGIEKWCTNEWRANKEGTKAYKAFYDKCSKKVKIYFEKVAAHSGDKYNDLADSLAKKAIGIE